MSKTALRKELAHLDAEELRSLIVDIYESGKEAKEWLDFFSDPDVDRLTERYRKEIMQEIRRSSRGISKMRITRVRRSVKRYASMGPGEEHVASLMTEIVEEFCRLPLSIRLKDTLESSLTAFLTETLTYIDSHNFVDRFLPRVMSAVNGIHSPFYRRSSLKRLMREAIEDFPASM